MGSPRRWPVREVPPELADRYLAEGWWTDETFGQTVAVGTARLADAAFVVHSATRPWRGTIAEVDRAARCFAGSLQAMGVGPGDVVVFQLPNWFEAAVTFWGAAYLGATVVPVVHFYGPKELRHVLDTVDPDVVVTAARFGATDHLGAHADLMAERLALPWFVVGADPDERLPAGTQPFEALLAGDPLGAPLSVPPDQPAVIGFTSGTTRNPKGVIHSHRTLGFEARQLHAMAPDSGPPQLTGAPVGHFIGMLAGLLLPLLRGRAIHLIDVWDPGEVLRVMLTDQVMVSGGATYFVTSLLDHPDLTDEHLALLPFAGLGGASVPLAVTERLTAAGVEVYRSYGSTEHPSITGCRLDDPLDKRLATDGPPLPGVEIRLDEQGEISSRGPDLCLGYTDADLTAEVFDGEGWYRTGDVGELDPDGYLTITDRLADVIIRGGENIGAAEVEDLLVRLPGVAEVAVVGVPDDRLGERAVAVIRVSPDGATPTLDELRTQLADAGLAKQKWPEAIHPVDELPRTPSGKVQKAKLRQLLRDEGVTFA